jgi:hypothetical protein
MKPTRENVCEPRVMALLLIRTRKRWVVAAVVVMLIGAGSLVALWPDPPHDPRAATFLRWNALALRHDGRAGAELCREPLFPEAQRLTESPYRDGIVDDIKIVEVVSVEPQRSEVHFRVRPRQPRSQQWHRRVIDRFSGDDRPWEYNDWYATMSFERGRWAVCNINVEYRQ